MPDKILVCERCEDKIDPIASHLHCKYCTPPEDLDVISEIREICPSVLRDGETVYFMSPSEGHMVSRLITNKRILEIKRKRFILNFLNIGKPNTVVKELKINEILRVHAPKAERWTRHTNYWIMIETVQKRFRFKFFNYKSVYDFTLKVKEAVKEFNKIH